MTTTSVWKAVAVSSFALLAVSASGGDAKAQGVIHSPNDHPDYKVEIEPHLTFVPGGWSGYYGRYGLGIGAGARFSIPVMDPGFIKSINDTVAISFGADFLHYSGCHGLRRTKFGAFREYGCDTNALLFPVALQWNFYVHERWSVFGEPGLFIYHFFVGDCGDFAGCPSATSVYPAFYAGGRFHFTEHVALTMRIGYPTFSVGVSFM